MLIDCDSCAVRGLACGDCVVTVLLGAPPEGVELDHADRSALDALAAGGLVPRLRLVSGDPRRVADRGAERQADQRARVAAGSRCDAECDFPAVRDTS